MSMDLRGSDERISFLEHNGSRLLFSKEASLFPLLNSFRPVQRGEIPGIFVETS